MDSNLTAQGKSLSGTVVGYNAKTGDFIWYKGAMRVVVNTYPKGLEYFEAKTSETIYVSYETLNAKGVRFA
jgi:hypothetical protein